MTKKEVKVRDPKDLPVQELIALADETIQGYKDRGLEAAIFFKFTCGSCGSRQQFEKPNTLYTSGACEECGEITEISEGGFALVVNAGKRPKGE